MREKHRLIRVWRTMHNRCSDQNVKSFKYYGGRGIAVCERWSGKAGFDNFIDDMSGYEEGLTLERIDNKGNYEPSNCRWATKAEQANNKRNNVNITFNGKTQTLAQWALEIGCTHGAIANRLAKGLDIAEALTKPIPKRANSKLSDEQVLFAIDNYPRYTYQEIADKLGVSKKTILNIIHGRIFKDLQETEERKLPPKRNLKVTDEEVNWIRANHSNFTHSELAVKFSVCRSLISQIINNKMRIKNLC